MLAAGARPGLMVIGALSGFALIAAVLLVGHSRRAAAALLILGTAPFAISAWTAIVPVLVLLLVAALAVPALTVPRPRSPATRCHRHVTPPQGLTSVQTVSSRKPAPTPSGE